MGCRALSRWSGAWGNRFDSPFAQGAVILVLAGAIASLHVHFAIINFQLFFRAVNAPIGIRAGNLFGSGIIQAEVEMPIPQSWSDQVNDVLLPGF